MDEIEQSQLKEIIRDVVTESHQSISAVQSNNLGQIKTTLAVLVEQSKQINQHLIELNGKSITNSKNIEELQKAKISFLSSFRTAKWMTGGAITLVFILIGAISSVSIYAYTQDKINLKSNTDLVAENLKNYQSQTQDNYTALFNLLKDEKKTN